ncbi:DUF3320 domain-containing protein [Paenibacillus mendelii]|uniref:DUF3320 domain-containing protein n=1 Tax=Paenibacillus mendelii TaxID=206163 RepID=A0ABV6JLI0_9BACL|nr:DUF3320 domain-containing protein [Paenibacillus mendelii]MCQ6563076.1 DUF3320 domain-containing protein [Paenibacillus mendelii]
MNDKIRCDWTYSETVNYAMQQNHVPVVKKIVLTNTTAGEDLRQVTVRLTAEPQFAFEWTQTYDIMPAGQSVDLGPIHLQMSASYLGGLTERVSGSIAIAIMQDTALLYEERVPIAVLAFDEWSGLAVLPEMVAAFVTPNQPEVPRIMREALDKLGEWSGSPSFTAYQSKDPNQVRMQAAAIYAALKNRAIAYCVAPPSFEQVGQRVRLPDTVFAHRMGNCLDLSLLYAACLEAAGLHPLLVFTEGHAFTGVWLVEETFSESVQDDISLLTKRIAPGISEICLMESTAFAAGQQIRFEEACALAAAHLHNLDQFDCLVDIRRARSGAIRPLPLRTASQDGPSADASPRPDGQSTDRSGAPEYVEVLERPQDVESLPMTRQKQWERRLLDLSLRNTLINFRLTRSSVPLMTNLLGDLEDALAEGGEFQLLAKPGDWQDDRRDVNAQPSIGSHHPYAELLREEFNRKRLRADIQAAELDKRLVHLYRSARVSLEENGANTLYLALGLLKWYETPVSQMPRYAPLVLIPVDIVRKSSRLGYVIRARDEEPQMNITLLEMLRQDFGIGIGGLDPLPRDEKGIDLKQIFTVLRHALMQMSRWDIEETAYLGLFSFGQFVMWNDIRSHAEALAENDIVASLMEGRLRGLADRTGSEEERLDEDHPGTQMTPISADSSQLSAIRAAAGGQSFVLHGPPGTGKSQTITNMIAGALAGGKRVLFVAEKMAALSVVQKRLDQIGLGPFCLELHSNKSTKRAVLDQLNAALEAPSVLSPEAWSVQAERLAGLRGELNGYVSGLHRPYPFGFSLFEAISEYERVGGPASDAASFEPAAIAELTPEKLTAWRDLASQLQVAGARCGNPAGHPLADARCTGYSQPLKVEVESLLERYVSDLPASRAALDDAASLLGLDPAPVGYEQIEILAQLCEWMIRIPDVKPALLQAQNLEEAVHQLQATAEQGRRRDEIKTAVLANYGPDVIRFDAQTALSEWTRTELQWFLPKWLGQNRVLKLMKGMAVSGAVLSKEQVKTHLSDIIRWQEEERKLKEAGAIAAPLLGLALWKDDQGDWDGLASACDWILRLQELLMVWFGNEAEAGAARSRIGNKLAGGRSAFLAQTNRLEAAVAARRKADAGERKLCELLQVDAAKLMGMEGAKDWYAFIGEKASRFAAHLDGLRDWCAWRRVRDQAEEAGLMPLIAPYEQGELTNDRLIAAFERGLYKACANFILAADSQLGAFSGGLFEESILRFKETDRRFEELTRQEIAARLSAKVPKMTQEAAQSSEAGILQRAIRRGGRALSIRKLFEQVPNLLPRLTPCMLMSPISVAQYLDPAGAKFDLVIFDEASQVPTSQAVGALARGTQAVIVGDPKQLPPTSFFSKTNEESDEEDIATQDMESILDDCLALGMPQMHLSWHYRSRHESLIAFSNTHYYDSKLMTFPSPDEPVSSVTWRPVEGYYDRGRTKQNVAEGEAVVAEIARRLRDPQLRTQSIGVVTFSSIQQTLIEDLLDETFKKEADLELLLPELPEPIFVKNLENVQGDERDVILFSVGYGPDAAGKISYNFGPLNRQGGWRRLNVAVSRARHEMMVFSTLRSHQLSASRTSAQGVLGLKAFLDYAEKGKQALPAGEAAKQVSTVSDIHRSLVEELNRLGYEADLYVGSSGYRIDVGILDPEQPGQYMLGLLLDGPMYRNAKTARDREILRLQVLGQLGWSLHRVWSPDWWENRNAELSSIRQVIQRAKESRRVEEPARDGAIGGLRDGQPAASYEGSPERVSDEEQIQDTLPGRGDLDQTDLLQGVKQDEKLDVLLGGLTGTVPGQSADSTLDDQIVKVSSADSRALDQSTGYTEQREESGAVAEPAVQAQRLASLYTADPRRLPSGAAWYTASELESVDLGTDAFYSPTHTPLILGQITRVIQEEGPISRSLLARRVLQAWGIARMGAKLDRRLEELLEKRSVRRTENGGTVFIWPEGVEPESYSMFRVASDDTQRRAAEDLPPEEIANTVKSVLFAQISLPAEDLVKQVARTLGYMRSGPALEKVVKNGIALAVERGFARQDGQDRIVYQDS